MTGSALLTLDFSVKVQGKFRKSWGLLAEAIKPPEQCTLDFPHCQAVRAARAWCVSDGTWGTCESC